MSKKEIQKLQKQRDKMQATIDKQSKRIEELRAPEYDEMLERIASQLPLFEKLGQYAGEQKKLTGIVEGFSPGHRRIMIEGLRSREIKMQMMVQDICIGTNKKRKKL